MTGTIERNAQIYDRLRLTEDIVAKALRVSELSQMSQIELRLRELLDKQWEARRSQATSKAGSLAKSGANAKQIAAAVQATMGAWPSDVTKRFNRDVEQIYKLARTAGYKKAKGKIKGSLAFNTPNATEQKVEKAKAEALPSFDLADQEAIRSLEARNTFWIGSHYDNNLSEAISGATKETLVAAGSSRRTAAILMAERVREVLGTVVTPGGFHGSSIQYFEGLAANAATVARTFGQIRSFTDVEVGQYSIVNPIDSRTCPICGHMDGKVFKLEQGQSQMARELEAENPEDIKALHPWLKIGDLLKLSAKPGRQRTGADSAKLSAAGLSLPPFHFRCRCTVDVTL